MFTVLKGLIRLICKAVFFVRLVGEEKVPKEGAVILAVNHTSMWDAVILVSACRRNMRTMAKKELFEYKLLAPILKLAGAFPVNRGTGDITAVKTALKALKDGEVFTIFPTGTRVKGDEAVGAKAGVALIAGRSGAPVIPVAMRGGYKPFHRVTVTFGDPMYLVSENGKKADSDELKRFADEVMEKINGLGV